MAKKIKPQALNDKWGGLICLKLGNSKPADFDNIIDTLNDKFDNNLFFSIDIVDLPTKIFLGSCEVMDRRQQSNQYIIQQSRISSTEITVFTYTLNVVDKTYNRYVAKKTLLIEEELQN